MLAGSISIRGDRVVVAGLAPPGDGLARSVLGQLLAEPDQHVARDWLLFVARTAAADVARRLADSGYLTRASGRRLWRSERWVPVDAECAFAPIIRVKAALGSPGAVAAEWAVLAGLAAACGLGHRLALYLPPGTHRRLDQAITQLDPGLRDLITHTQAVVDSALLSHRV